MTHPSYSYLSPSTIELALQLARELTQAASDMARLTSGGASIAYNQLAGGGRVGDKAVAVKDWVGPHRDTFELLFENEMQSAATTETRLADEADAWATFWATAINARNARLHDEAMSVYNSSMSSYQTQVQSYQDAIAEDPALQELLYLPSPPLAPRRPPVVSVPTSSSNYQPTG